MTEREFAQKIAAGGGRAYIVGGSVRDEILGLAENDRDYAVSGLDAASFCAIFPEQKCIGQSFPVFLIDIDNKPCEVALCRKERKSGFGYQGFSVSASHVSIEDDLRRRDTTMNSLAKDILTGEIIDPFGGTKDIANKTIRLTSPHFSEDPVRALRVARQAAEFDFSVTSETLAAMRRLHQELEKENGERFTKELCRILRLNAKRPSRFFRILAETGLIDTAYPELAALIGKSQPSAYHPEGDAWEHTLLIFDLVSLATPSPIARFAALCHDLGKGLTPPYMLPHHYGHEQAGLAALEKWNERTPLPKPFLKSARFVARTHMAAPRHRHAGKIVDLLLGLERLSQWLDPDDYGKIIAFDMNMPTIGKNPSAFLAEELPLLPLPVYLSSWRECLAIIKSVDGNDAPKKLRGADIGKWLRAKRANKLASEIKNLAAR